MSLSKMVLYTLFLHYQKHSKKNLYEKKNETILSVYSVIPVQFTVLFFLSENIEAKISKHQ